MPTPQVLQVSQHDSLGERLHQCVRPLRQQVLPGQQPMPAVRVEAGSYRCRARCSAGTWHNVTDRGCGCCSSCNPAPGERQVAWAAIHAARWHGRCHRRALASARRRESRRRPGPHAVHPREAHGARGHDGARYGCHDVRPVHAASAATGSWAAATVDGPSPRHGCRPLQQQPTRAARGVRPRRSRRCGASEMDPRPGGSNEPPGVVGLLGSDWLHAAGSAAAVTFDWRHGLCRIAMDGGSSTWDIPLVAPRAAEGDGVRCVVEVPTTAAAADSATDTPPWTLPPTWRRVAHVRSARDKAARTLPTLADNPDRPASYTADELVRIVTERAAAAREPEDMLAFQAARERVLRAGYHGAFGESIQGRPPMKCKPVSIDVGGHKPIYTAP